MSSVLVSKIDVMDPMGNKKTLKSFITEDGQLDYKLINNNGMLFSIQNLQLKKALPSHVLDLKYDFDYQCEEDFQSVIEYCITTSVYTFIPKSFRQYQKIQNYVTV